MPTETTPDTAHAAPPVGELDSLKRPYDSTKFLPEKDAIGRWKNRRAGRRRRVDTPADPAAPAEKSAPPPPANLFADIEQAAGTPSAADASGGAGDVVVEPAPPEDAKLSPEAGGNLLAKALYTVTGTVTGDRKAAVARGAEHKMIADTFCAYLGFRGIALVGGLAMGATVLAYLLDETRADSVWAAVRKFFAPKPMKRAEPVAAPSPGAAAAAAADTEHAPASPVSAASLPTGRF